jgi:hypothetical protein
MKSISDTRKPKKKNNNKIWEYTNMEVPKFSQTQVIPEQRKEKATGDGEIAIGISNMSVVVPNLGR